MNKEPKLLFLDIEATALNAVFGVCLCVGYKWLGESKVYVPTILDGPTTGMLDDKELLRKFSEIYNSADYVCGHYAMYYDIPFLQTRLLKHRLPPLDTRIPLVDTWWVARKTLKLYNNRLDTLAKYIGVQHSKTPLTPDDWIQAAHGSKKSLKYIVEHCKMDVLVLEECYQALRPFMKNEPARGLFLDCEPNTCISCGSRKLQRRGYSTAKTRRRPRYQCQGCGKWQQGTESEKRTALVG
jgi:uncharacterized protein YprB with RNaseH-like and TPR domain